MTGIVPTLAEPPPHSQLLLAAPLALVRTMLQLVLLLGQSAVALRPPQPRPRLEKFYEGLKEWGYVAEELLAAQTNGFLKPGAGLTLTVPPPPRALPDEALQQFAAVVGGEAKLEFLFQLLLAAGLFQPGHPVTVWQEVKIPFMARSEPEQWAVLVRTYLDLLAWNELWELIRITPGLTLKRPWQFRYFKPADLQALLLNMRQKVLRVLACLPDNQWVAFEVFCQLMRQVWPLADSQLEQQGYPETQRIWFLSQNGRSLNTTSLADWNLVQGGFIHQMLTGPLHWLGLADVCLDGDQVVAFRLHGLADIYWDVGEVPRMPGTAVSPLSTPAPAALTAEGNRLIVNPTTLHAQAHTFLGKICQLSETSPHRFVYHLDVQAVHTAFEAGLTLAQLQEEWETTLAVPIPPSFQTALTTWWQRYGQVRLYENVTLIELGDEYALAEMKAMTSLNNLLIAEISPRLVLIPESAVPILTAELEKAGYTPKKEEG